VQIMTRGDLPVSSRLEKSGMSVRRYTEKRACGGKAGERWNGPRYLGEIMCTVGGGGGLDTGHYWDHRRGLYSCKWSAQMVDRDLRALWTRGV